MSGRRGTSQPVLSRGADVASIRAPTAPAGPGSRLGGQSVRGHRQPISERRPQHGLPGPLSVSAASSRGIPATSTSQTNASMPVAARIVTAGQCRDEPSSGSTDSASSSHPITRPRSTGPVSGTPGCSDTRSAARNCGSLDTRAGYPNSPATAHTGGQHRRVRPCGEAGWPHGRPRRRLRLNRDQGSAAVRHLANHGVAELACMASGVAYSSKGGSRRRPRSPKERDGQLVAVGHGPSSPGASASATARLPGCCAVRVLRGRARRKRRAIDGVTADLDGLRVVVETGVCSRWQCAVDPTSLDLP